MSAPRPNLFIVGAMKCATTSLHAYLGTHPAIFMSSPKEPSHFVDRETLYALWPRLAHQGYWRVEKYLDLFRAAGSALVIGESSTNYSKLPQARGVPERIAAFNPNARFLYVMRDPLRRTISHYWHHARTQREHRDMLTALREDPQYVDVSHYAMQLRPYLEIFGRERVKALVTEELQTDPLGTVQDVFRWLGVDPEFVPPNVGQRRGVTPERFDDARTVPLVRRFHDSKLWSTMAPAISSGLKSVARRYLYRRRPVQISPVLPREVTDYLRPILIAQVEELRGLLGRDFSVWTTLDGAPGSTDAARAQRADGRLSGSRAGVAG